MNKRPTFYCGVLLVVLTFLLVINPVRAFEEEAITFDITKSNVLDFPYLNSSQGRTWTNLENAFDNSPTTTYTNTSNELHGSLEGLLNVNFSNEYYYLLNWTYTAQMTNLNNGGSIQYKVYSYCPTQVEEDTFSTAYALTTRSGDLNKFCYMALMYMRPINTQTNINDYSRLYNFELWAYEDGVLLNATDEDSNALDNFTATLYDENLTLIEQGTTSTYFAWFNMSIQEANLNYTITFNKSGYETITNTFNYTRNHAIGNLYSYTASTSVLPSINITFYDLLNDNIVNNVTLIFDGDTSYFEANTTTGNYYNNDLTAGYYRILPISSGYASNEYYINLTPATKGVITAYLINSTNTNNITLTTQDSSLIAVPNALVNVYFRNGTQLKHVGTGSTDVLGRTDFTLNPSYTHRFVIEADGYTTKQFDYLPVEDLTITLSDTTAIDYTTIFGTISYTITPASSILTANDTQYFTFMVSDSSSGLSSIGIFYINGSDFATGVPSGTTLTLNVNTSKYANDRILFYYNFTTLDGDFYETSQSYYIQSSEGSNTSGFYAFNNIVDSGRGLLLLAVLLIIGVMIALARVGLPAGLITLVGALVLGVFTWLGWVNGWLGYSTAILVFLLTIFRGGVFE